MDGAWDFYLRQVENRPAYIMVDSALASFAPLKTHPDLVNCRIEVKSFREDGLPDQKAFKAIYGFEDVANKVAQKSGQNIYAGRFGIANHVTYHFYAIAGDALIKGLEMSPELIAITPFVCTSQNDSGWSVYLATLLPSPTERDGIENTKVREQLLKAGDNLTALRAIDHFAYFESTAGLNAFRSAVEQQGYKIVEAAKVLNDQGLFALSFTKDQSPAEIDPITWELGLLAKSHRGQYDGWACPVIRSTK